MSALAILPFKRLLKILEALPTRLGDGVPLSEVIPGAWPTVGDLRQLCAAPKKRK